MPETSFRRLAMADLDEVALRRLIDEGETLFVERKQAIPSESLGPTVASFANALGGWVLLGVADDKTIHGYMATGDFVDHLRQTLRAELDPLPPFAAEWSRSTARRSAWFASSSRLIPRISSSALEASTSASRVASARSKATAS